MVEFVVDRVGWVLLCLVLLFWLFGIVLVVLSFCLDLVFIDLVSLVCCFCLGTYCFVGVVGYVYLLYF